MGHPGELGRELMPVARALVEACGVAPGQRVLDVGAGEGNVATAAARSGAAVVAANGSEAAVEAGRSRTRRAGIEVDWVQADAAALPFEDGSFDAVLSAFGAMFAPATKSVAAEMTRVVRPGGVVGMANWASAGFMSRVLDLAVGARPLPPGATRPSRWGRYETLYLLFHRAEPLQVADGAVRLERADDEAMWELLSAPGGPLAPAANVLGDDRRAALRAEAAALVGGHAVPDTRPRAVVDAEYVLAVARKSELADRPPAAEPVRAGPPASG